MIGSVGKQPPLLATLWQREMAGRFTHVGKPAALSQLLEWLVCKKATPPDIERMIDYCALVGPWLPEPGDYDLVVKPRASASLHPQQKSRSLPMPLSHRALGKLALAADVV